MVALQQIPVHAEHIFQACLSLDFKQEELFNPIHVWTQQQLNQSIEADLFRKLLEEAVGTRDADRGEFRSWRTLAGQVLGSSFYHDADQYLREYARKPAEVVVASLA